MLVYEDIYYPPAGEYRTLHIWLPETYYYGYERFPVVYFFDGHNLFDDAHATFGRSWRFADFLMPWEKPVIIVGIECSHAPDGRMQEYSPYHSSRRKSFVPLGDATMKWIAEVVKPTIDNQFRTWPHREATGIGGASMGGVMAMYGVLRYNHIFSKAACVSAGVFRILRRYTEELNHAQINPDTRIYISWGEIEAGKAPHNGNPETGTREARAVYKFEKALNEKGILTYHYFQKDGRHNEEDWEKQIPVFMNWLWLDRG